MCVSVCLTRAVMAVVHALRRQTVEPLLDVLNQPVLCVVDVDPGRDVHGRDQQHALFNPALIQDLFRLWGNVDEFAVFPGIEPEILGVRLHNHDQFSLKE